MFGQELSQKRSWQFWAGIARRSMSLSFAFCRAVPDLRFYFELTTYNFSYWPNSEVMHNIMFLRADD